MEDRVRAEFLIQRNQQLLDSIVNLDYETYDSLCADDMSCMEPESNQNLVIGKAFHKYYFDVFGGGGGGSEPMASSNNSSDNCNEAPTTHTNVTMVQPHVQWIGGSATSTNTNTNTTSDGDRQQTVAAAAAAVPTGAVLSYVKLTQQTTDGKAPVTIQQSETRVWEYRNTTNGGWIWVNIHLHKSPVLRWWLYTTTLH